MKSTNAMVVHCNSIPDANAFPYCPPNTRVARPGRILHRWGVRYIRFIAVLSCIGLLSTSSVLLSQTPVATGNPSVIPTLDSMPHRLCSDLVMQLNARKGRKGTVQLNAILTNMGPGQLSAVNGPLEVLFVVNTRYPPKTYNQCAMSEEIGRKKIGATLKPGEKVSFSYQLKLSDFVTWNTGNVGSGQREVEKLITAIVRRQSLHVFSHCEDSNESNTHANTTIAYTGISN
ncbi:MAG: hypothetical protein JW706_05965 [Opitutales bacterium]|nr:hypothetical protein [Opitutales bacterium]